MLRTSAKELHHRQQVLAYIHIFLIQEKQYFIVTRYHYIASLSSAGFSVQWAISQSACLQQVSQLHRLLLTVGDSFVFAILMVLYMALYCYRHVFIQCPMIKLIVFLDLIIYWDVCIVIHYSCHFFLLTTGPTRLMFLHLFIFILTQKLMHRFSWLSVLANWKRLGFELPCPN